jgi:predicted kinase
MAPPRPRLVLLCGLPGSGKTTIGTRLAAEMNAVRLSPDEWLMALGIDLWDEDARRRLEALFWNLGQELLGSGVSVILDSGFWLRSDRDEKRLGARRLGAAVELRYLETSIDELARRLQVRDERDEPGMPTITRSKSRNVAGSF